MPLSFCILLQKFFYDMLCLKFFTSDLISADDVEQLKDIFEELSVGVSGYLDMQELSIVCEHIGMDNIQDQVVYFSSSILLRLQILDPP